MPSNSQSGYMGSVLEVDLSTETINSTELDQSLLELFVGGRPLAIALLVNQLMKKRDRYKNPIGEIDPLSEDNALVFCTSPFTGSKVPTASRFHVAFKSPLTNGIGSSNSGGKWGVEFKKTGYDALVVKGQASRPLVLWVDGNGARLKPPPPSNSEDVQEITNGIQSSSSSQFKVMTVGAAGRHLSPIACIINDGGRALGRGGAGAVFGSKNLFAIAVKGSNPTATHNPKALQPDNRAGSVFKARAKLRIGKMTKTEKQYGILSSMGTNGLMGMLAQYDELLHKNFKDNQHSEDDLSRIQGEAFLNHDTVKVRRGACHQCPIGCTRVTQIENDKGEVVSRGEGPEFETVAMFGANLHIYNLEIITEANYLCNHYGFDTISMGGTIATLMEIYDKVVGIDQSELSKKETRLLEESAGFTALHGAPVFGNSRCLSPLIKAAAKGEGIGKTIALGAKRLAERFGHPESAMTVKGMELPAYDPRATWTQALSYMISPRGGCHLQGGYSAPLAFCAGYGEFPGNKVEGTALVVRNVCYQNYIYDTLGVCAFAGFSVTLDELANMFVDVTGNVYKGSDLEHIAKRCLTLERLFNHQAGIRKDDDWLPTRFFDEPVTVDGYKVRCDIKAFAKMREEFYDSMGWDKDGLPTENTLDEVTLKSYLKGNGFDFPM